MKCCHTRRQAQFWYGQRQADNNNGHVAAVGRDLHLGWIWIISEGWDANNDGCKDSIRRRSIHFKKRNCNKLVLFVISGRRKPGDATALSKKGQG